MREWKPGLMVTFLSSSLKLDSMKTVSHKLENLLDMDSANCENLSHTWVNTKVRPLLKLFSYHFLLHQLTQKETMKQIVWNKIFHALTVTAFHYMPLDKPNGILTMTLKS